MFELCWWLAGEIPIVIAKTPQVWGRVVAAPKHRPHRVPLPARQSNVLLYSQKFYYIFKKKSQM